MKYLFSLPAILSLVLADAGFVHVPVSVKKANVSNVKYESSAAHIPLPDSLVNAVQQYFVDIELGTPGQKQTVSIDTGSSDLWVHGVNSNDGDTFYDPSQSSTAHYVDDGFSITYVDTTGAYGDYYTDDSVLGNANVNFQFAVSNKDNGGYGVFGIASVDDEADRYGTYPNYPVALKQNGITESTAYSLYLDTVTSESGSLLFGGIDKSKFSGPLYTVPITSPSSFSVDFEVQNHRINGVLDAGTSYTYLPDDIASSLAQSFGAFWSLGNYGLGYYVNDVPSDASVTYNFSGVKVTVSASELFLTTGGGNYFFTILPSSQAEQNVLLGDSFLRSAYVVYDLDNNQIGITQADYNGSGPIQAITSSGIPDSQPAPGF